MTDFLANFSSRFFKEPYATFHARLAIKNVFAIRFAVEISQSKQIIVRNQNELIIVCEPIWMLINFKGNNEVCCVLDLLWCIVQY